MIKLKQLIKYDNANCLEATWVDVQTETYEAPVMEVNEEGIEVDSGKIETKTREIETVVKCHAYADVQIDMLRIDAAEMGTSLDEYENLIAEVEVNIVLLTQEELQAEINKQLIAEAYAYLASTAWYIERFNDPSSGKAIPQEVLDKRAQARVTINELEV